MTRSPAARRWSLPVSFLLAGLVAACGSDSSMMEVQDETTTPIGVQHLIAAPTDPFAGDDNGRAYVCVVSPVAGTYSFDITGAPAPGSGNPGPSITNDPADMGPGVCEQVATFGAGAGWNDPDRVTASQISMPAGVVLSDVMVEDALYPFQGTANLPYNIIVTHPGDPATGLISNEAATRITFTYTEEQGGGGQGCTPGYWKQDQHFTNWVGYTPDQLFSSVFEDAFPGMSLVEVAAQGGGGLKALGRHVVAALLNASSGAVDYGMTTTEVIDAFNAVFPGDYESLKNELVGRNESGCPL